MFKLKGTNRPLTTNEDVRGTFLHMISESVLELRESGNVLYDYNYYLFTRAFFRLLLQATYIPAAPGCA